MSPAPQERPAARALRVRVTENGNRKVDLTMPAAAAASLADLMSDDVAEKARARGIDVAAIAAAAVGGGFHPGDLFQLTDGEKEVRVWLE